MWTREENKERKTPDGWLVPSRARHMHMAVRV